MWHARIMLACAAVVSSACAPSLHERSLLLADARIRYELSATGNGHQIEEASLVLTIDARPIIVNRATIVDTCPGDSIVVVTASQSSPRR